MLTLFLEARALGLSSLSRCGIKGGHELGGLASAIVVLYGVALTIACSHIVAVVRAGPSYPWHGVSFSPEGVRCPAWDGIRDETTVSGVADAINSRIKRLRESGV